MSHVSAFTSPAACASHRGEVAGPTVRLYAYRKLAYVVRLLYDSSLAVGVARTVVPQLRTLNFEFIAQLASSLVAVRCQNSQMATRDLLVLAPALSLTDPALRSPRCKRGRQGIRRTSRHLAMIGGALALAVPAAPLRNKLARTLGSKPKPVGRGARGGPLNLP